MTKNEHTPVRMTEKECARSSIRCSSSPVEKVIRPLSKFTRSHVNSRMAVIRAAVEGSKAIVKAMCC